MRIKGRELRQIIREVLSEGAFDSAAYIAGRIDPPYKPEVLEPQPERREESLPDTPEARAFSYIIDNIAELSGDPDVAFIMQQLRSDAKNMAVIADEKGLEAAVRSLLRSYERWSQDPAAGRRAPRPLRSREEVEAYREELRQKFDEIIVSLDPMSNIDVPETGESFAKRIGHHHRAGLPAPDPEDYF
jgi:hypothetical protein